MENLKDRLVSIAKQKKLSIRAFEEHCGLGRGNISNMSADGALGSDKLTKIIDTFPEVDLHWLLTGIYSGASAVIEAQDLPNKATPASKPGEGIPLIPIEAMAGALSGEMPVLEYECDRYVVPMFKGADFLIPVKGSSMYPKYSSGDIVACQRVPMKDLFFQWNKVYVIDTCQGALIKRIRPGSDKDHVLIVSDNEKYSPFELPLTAIYAVALVIGVIRLE